MNRTGWNPLSSLVARCAIFNIAVAAALSFGYFSGPLRQYLVDETYITHIIGIFAILTFIVSLCVANAIQKDWKQIGIFQAQFATAILKDRRSEFKEALVEKYSRRFSWLERSGPILLSLGLLGTIVGISNGMVGLEPGLASNLSAAEALIVSLGAGLSTSFNTTLVGIVGMIWGIINLQIVKNETSRLYQTIIMDGDM